MIQFSHTFMCSVAVTVKLKLMPLTHPPCDNSYAACNKRGIGPTSHLPTGCYRNVPMHRDGDIQPGKF